MFFLSAANDLRLGGDQGRAGEQSAAFSLLTHFCVLGTRPFPLRVQTGMFSWLRTRSSHRTGCTGLPQHQNQPCAAPCSLCFPNLSHLEGAEGQLGPQERLTGLLKVQKHLAGASRPPELRVGMRMRMRLWCSPGSAAAPLAHPCSPWFSPHFPCRKCGVFIRPCSDSWSFPGFGAIRAAGSSRQEE